MSFISSPPASIVNAKTVFFGDSRGPDVVEIECSPPSASHSRVLTWYNNGELIEGFTNSSLTVAYENSSNVFGVYQCFIAVSRHSTSVEEIAMTRVLPYGELVEGNMIHCTHQFSYEIHRYL